MVVDERNDHVGLRLLDLSAHLIEPFEEPLDLSGIRTIHLITKSGSVRHAHRDDDTPIYLC